MKTRRSLRLVALALTLTRRSPCFFGAAVLVAAHSLPAADTNASKPGSAPAVANVAKKLPVESSFAKEKSGENAGLSVLTLKNVSATPLKITATVDLSVTVHNRPKTRAVPAQEIAPGKTATIDALAAHDKVTLVADGFAPLQITVP